MSIETVERTVFICDQDPGHRAETDRGDELPPEWARFEDREFSSLECLSRWLRGRGPVLIGLRTIGTGNATRKTLDEVVGITARSWEEVAGCKSCGGTRGHHRAGCTTHR